MQGMALNIYAVKMGEIGFSSPWKPYLNYFRNLSTGLHICRQTGHSNWRETPLGRSPCLNMGVVIQDMPK